MLGIDLPGRFRLAHIAAVVTRKRAKLDVAFFSVPGNPDLHPEESRNRELMLDGVSGVLDLAHDGIPQ